MDVEGTHWISDEHPDLVNRSIREHIGRLAAAP
jgi:hypothetical protein